MAFITEAEAREAAKAAVRVQNRDANRILAEAIHLPVSIFDIFLSHSIKDSELVLGVKELLEKAGRSVYVDWIVDPKLNRENVTPATAKLIRNRMKQCRSLFYLHTKNAVLSKWVPWELGFFDGMNGNVGVLPVVIMGDAGFRGVEYLGLYPVVDLKVLAGSGRAKAVYINRDSSLTGQALGFRNWVNGPEKLRAR